MKTSWRSASLVATAAFVLALTTACGQEKSPASSQNVGSTQAAGDLGAGAGDLGATAGAGAGAGAGQNAAAQGVAAGTLAVNNDKKLGKVLTDSAGFTLYRFDKDTAEPPKTNCDGDCAVAWPPVPADGAQAAAGIDKSLLGEVTRSDGTKQLTVDGWAVYRYAKDTKAGDAKGQGVGGTWYALAPDGKKAGVKSGGNGGGNNGGGNGGGAVQAGLSTRNDSELGEVVVDKNGMTVYGFVKDVRWPMKAACTGACLEKWPIVDPVEKNDTKGIKLKGYVTFDRPDGAVQQSIDCRLLYTFAGDKKPGDTNGQGVGGTWYAVSPNGDLIGAPKK